MFVKLHWTDAYLTVISCKCISNMIAYSWFSAIHNESQWYHVLLYIKIIKMCKLYLNSYHKFSQYYWLFSLLVIYEMINIHWVAQPIRLHKSSYGTVNRYMSKWAYISMAYGVAIIFSSSLYTVFYVCLKLFECFIMVHIALYVYIYMYVC